MSELEAAIEAAFDARDTVTPASDDVRKIVDEALGLLDSGKARVAEKIDGEWVVNQWLKKAVLLSFRLNDNTVMEYGSAGAPAFAGSRWRSTPSRGPGTEPCGSRSASVATTRHAPSVPHTSIR